MTIDLTSSEDTFLFLLQGSGRGGAEEDQNDDIVSGNTDSQVVATLAAGTYTIEATTYNAATTGTFSLAVSVAGGAAGASPTTDSCLEDLGSLTGTVTRSGSWRGGQLHPPPTARRRTARAATPGTTPSPWVRRGR